MLVNLSVVNGKLVGFDGDDKWYIGRGGKGKKGSALANPFVIGKDGSREDVILKYRKWLYGEILKGSKAVITELKLIYELSKKGKLKLVCFCKPLACHGDVIINCLKWMEQEGML